MSNETKKGPLDELTPALRTRLNQLESNIGLEGVTVSFSLDGDRDGHGRRKSAFNNARAVPKSGAWTRSEAQIVRCIMSKDVVLATYRDAVFRGIMAKTSAGEEANGIIAHYDASIANLLKKPASSEAVGGDRCEDCGEPQYMTDSGVTCPNGHGGAGSLRAEQSDNDETPEAALAAFSP